MSAPASPLNPVSLVSLRCGSCGAPIGAGASADIVRCDHCGTSQRLVDARAFLDQIMLQVNGFVRQALPLGLDANAIGTIDPIARHSVFAGNVRPRLETDHREYRFRWFSLLSNCLAILPFFAENITQVTDTPKDVFVLQAKVQSVTPLAVDDESRQLVIEMNGLAVAYANLLTNVSLMAGGQPERNYLMARNFRSASEALRGLTKYAPISDRLAGLASAYAAFDHLMSGRIHETLSELRQSRTTLEHAKEAVIRDFEFAIMLQAIEKEISTVRSTEYVADACLNDPKGEPLRTLGLLRKLLEVLRGFQNASADRWRPSFRTVEHQEYILMETARIRHAQRGEAILAILPGSGTVLFPFWIVEVPYTFQTGALWKTRGVEVSEAILVAATFPADGAAFAASDPSNVLTDVFRARSRDGLLAGTLKQLTGTETAISAGGPVRDIILRARKGDAAGFAVIPPLTTPKDVPGLVQDYLHQVRQTDPKVGEQLRLSSPRVGSLVYIPATPQAFRVNAMPWMGPMAPRSVGDLGLLANIAL